MGFVAICTAIYDYQPQSSGELEIKEGELLYILEKSTDDDWWKAKKKAAGDDDDEPEGLIPNNYVEDAKPLSAAKALYDYSRQTDEEVSFTEDTDLNVYDTSDPDWTLVGVGDDYGFAPANYIEVVSSGTAAPAPAPAAVPGLPPRSPSVRSRGYSNPAAGEPEAPASPVSPARSVQGPAANLARVLGGGAPTSPIAARTISSPPAPRQQFTPEASDEDEPAPALPRRPLSQEHSQGPLPSPPYNRAVPVPEDEAHHLRTPGGFHLYNISEMVSAMGRRKKLPTTLGINIATGTIMLAPEKSKDGPQQEWTAEKMTHYSIEGKHVFIELVRPSKSLDLHAGARDTAEEIVSALGEIAGAQRAEGLREVITAANGGGSHKKGQVLYDFMAQGDDEVTVGVGDEVIILDDTKSEEWWNVRRLKNGNEGVVPSSYIEITGFATIEPPSRSGVNAGLSTVDQNRIEEQRLAREAAKAERARQDAEAAKARSDIPQRGSSLAEEQPPPRKDRRDREERKKSRSKPDSSKVRTWTDHSGTFKVEAQFLGVSDGKIHLHKVNGVKIAVPVTKMSPEDLEYIEKVTNESIEEHIPVADLIKMKRRSQEPSHASRSVQPRAPEQPKVPDYDWFDFFLKSGVNPHQCERYSQAMIRDSMDESVLPDITAETLRTLGIKEGDILKIMKFLDQKFGRVRAPSTNGTNGEQAQGGLFSKEGGALHNNTRRGRPEATRATSDVVDADAFATKEEKKEPPPEAKATPLTQAPPREPVQSGFDDDAWAVKTPAQATRPRAASAASQSATAPAPQPPRQPTGATRDLTALLDGPLPAPLQPTPAPVAPPAPVQQLPPQPQPQPAPAPAPAPVLSPSIQQPQQSGANPAFFSQLPGQLPPQQTGFQAQPPLQPQVTAFQTQPPLNIPRQRPLPPQQPSTGLALLSPPPRPTSAPQNPNQSQFGLRPLQPQLTGFPSTAALQAPPGQSLNDLSQQRLQQQFQQLQVQPQPTGFPQQTQQFGLAPQPTGFQQPQQFGQFQQPYLNGNAAGSPFADPRPSFQPQPNAFQGPPPGGINSILPPALQPQRTGFGSPPPQQQINGFGQGIQPQQTGFPQPQQFQPQPTGFQPQQIQPQATGFGQLPQQNGFGNFQQSSVPPVPPLPPMPQLPTLAPLQAQKTGPAPDVKFGNQPKKLTPQPTGRRANLANASAANPFGF